MTRKLALALAFAASALTASVAQAQFGNFKPPYTPAKDARDLRAVLYNWTWYTGMLRGLDEHELMASLEYQGAGTVQVDGQPCRLTKYRASINYQLPGERIQYSCTRANGQTYTSIEVVSGQYAWNEDIAGAEIVAGKGKATPMPAAVQERLIRFWASPQGAPKAAILGVNDKSEWGANPATLLQDGLTTAGKTSLTWEGARAVLTFPIPGVAGATGTATLDAKFMAERVVVRELTTTETETGSVYVVMPVPASVKRAITVTATAAPDRPLPEPPTFMRVVEKFTRQGNAINYEVTIEDPEVLVEPWVMTPRTMRLIPNAEAGLLPERGNCEVYEEGEITSQIRP